MLWGPGRHRPGDNLYAYYLDASGAMIECSGAMALIADDAHFTPNVITNLARPGNVREMNVWGTPAPLEWREFHFPFDSPTLGCNAMRDGSVAGLLTPTHENVVRSA